MAGSVTPNANDTQPRCACPGRRTPLESPVTGGAQALISQGVGCRRATPGVRGRLVFVFTRHPRALLSDLHTPERVKVPLVSRSKRDVLRALVQLATPSASEDARNRTVSTVLEREPLGRISRILRHDTVREQPNGAATAEACLDQLVGGEAP